MNIDFISIVNEEINNTDNTNYKIYLEKLVNFYKEPSEYEKDMSSYRRIISYIAKNDYRNIIMFFTFKYRKTKYMNLYKNYSLVNVKSEIEATDKLLKEDYSDKLFKHKLEFQEKLDKLTKMTEEERKNECAKKQQVISEEYEEYMELITKKVIEKLGVSVKEELDVEEEKSQKTNKIKNEDIRNATNLILNYIREAKEEVLTEIEKIKIELLNL